jgi:hypothetical protein
MREIVDVGERVGMPWDIQAEQTRPIEPEGWARVVALAEVQEKRMKEEAEKVATELRSIG